MSGEPDVCQATFPRLEFGGQWRGGSWFSLPEEDAAVGGLHDGINSQLRVTVGGINRLVFLEGTAGARRVPGRSTRGTGIPAAASGDRSRSVEAAEGAPDEVDIIILAAAKYGGVRLRTARSTKLSGSSR